MYFYICSICNSANISLVNILVSHPSLFPEPLPSFFYCFKHIFFIVPWICAWLLCFDLNSRNSRYYIQFTKAMFALLATCSNLPMFPLVLRPSYNTLRPTLFLPFVKCLVTVCAEFYLPRTETFSFTDCYIGETFVALPNRFLCSPRSNCQCFLNYCILFLCSS